MAFTSQLTFSNSNAVTITLASLADGAIATSSTIDNSSDKFISADIQVKLRTGTGVNSNGTVAIFWLRSVDSGTDFDFTANDNAEVLGAFAVDVDSTDYRFSVDTTRMGFMSSHWRIAIRNDTGAAFDATGSNFSVEYAGKKFEIV